MLKKVRSISSDIDYLKGMSFGHKNKNSFVYSKMLLQPWKKMKPKIVMVSL